LELKPVRLAISLGDPRGIGPEVAAAATRRMRTQTAASFIFVGPDHSPVQHDADQYVSVGSYAGGDIASAGRIAGLAIRTAVELVMRGDADAIVTAPIDKYALHAGGFYYPGHTEMLADLAGCPSVVMMLASEKTVLGGPLRVVLATTHLPLADVAITLYAELIVVQSMVNF
jgi:4-hydroxythreonine-4-phosphate dehydrogenase